MEQFKGICDTVYNTVFELAEKGLYGIIFLGVFTIIFVIISILFNHFEITRKSAIVTYGLRSSYLYVCYATCFGLTMLAKVVFGWEYTTVHAIEISAIILVANLLVYAILTTFIVFPVIFVIRRTKHKNKRKLIKSTKVKNQNINLTEYNTDIDIMVSEHTRVWLRKKMKETGLNNRVQILQDNKKDYIESTAETLNSLCKNPHEIAQNYYIKYLDLWK